MLLVIDLAGGQLDEFALQRITVLPLHHQLAVVEQGQHGDRAGMGDVFARAGAAVRQQHVVLAHSDEIAVVHHAAVYLLLCQVHVRPPQTNTPAAAGASVQVFVTLNAARTAAPRTWRRSRPWAARRPSRTSRAAS